MHHTSMMSEELVEDGQKAKKLATIVMLAQMHYPRVELVGNQTKKYAISASPLVSLLVDQYIESICLLVT